tara:strand:- start:1250 stop:2485 length:1236 start_codon:yes stop_codon:yes gene_type:complete
MKKLLPNIHRFLGLFLVLNFFILCSTGAILIWKEELSSKQNHSISEVTLDSLIEIERNVNSGLDPNKERILAIIPKSSEEIQVRIGGLNQVVLRGSEKIYFNAKAERITQPRKEKSVIQFIFDLHANLLLGNLGKILLFLIGVFLIISLFTGQKLSQKYLKVKNIKNSLILHRYIHSMVARKLLPWLSLVILTGIFLAANSILIGLFIAEISSNKNSQVEYSTIEQAVTSWRSDETLKKLKPSFIAYPGTEFAPSNGLLTLFEGDEVSEKLIVFNSSRKNDHYKILDLPWYLSAIILSEPLHFGNFGGYLLKIIWTCLALLAGYIPLSGLVIFYLRKNSIRQLSTAVEPLFSRWDKSILPSLLAVLIVVFLFLLQEFTLLTLFISLILFFDWKNIIDLMGKKVFYVNNRAR